MIDPDTIENDYPSLSQALGGGAMAKAAIDDLVALLRRAGVEVPAYPPDAAPAVDNGSQGTGVVDPDTEISRGEFFQVLTGSLPERLAE